MSFLRLGPPRRTEAPAGAVNLRTAVLVGALALLAISLGLGRDGPKSGRPAAGGPSSAPAVSLPATTGRTVNLAQFRGKRNVLLYFYEHAG